MTNFTQHLAAALTAVFVVTVSFTTIISVPPAEHAMLIVSTLA